MENKQTAVDYLLIQISARIDIIKPNALEVALLQDVYYKAKAMEKEQIIQAHFEGWGDAYDYLKDEHSDARQAEDYYNETYGTK